MAAGFALFPDVGGDFQVLAFGLSWFLFLSEPCHALKCRGWPRKSQLQGREVRPGARGEWRDQWGVARVSGEWGEPSGEWGEPSGQGGVGRLHEVGAERFS